MRSCTQNGLTVSWQQGLGIVRSIGCFPVPPGTLGGPLDFEESSALTLNELKIFKAICTNKRSICIENMLGRRADYQLTCACLTFSLSHFCHWRPNKEELRTHSSADVHSSHNTFCYSAVHIQECYFLFISRTVRIQVYRIF